MNNRNVTSNSLVSEYNYGVIQELRLDRPPVNAFDGALVKQLTDRLRALPQEGKRALVLSGPQGIFSGGFDVKAFQSLEREDVKRFVRAYIELQYVIAVSPIPIIAAITGHCAAGGTSLAILCDHRIMARGAFRIGMNEVQFGLIAGKIIHAVLRRLIGARHAERLLTTAELVSTDEALRIGLVDAAVDPDRVILDAHDYAERLTRLPPMAFKGTRQVVRAELVKLFDGSARQDATEDMTTAILSEEAQAAIKAWRTHPDRGA